LQLGCVEIGKRGIGYFRENPPPCAGNHPLPHKLKCRLRIRVGSAKHHKQVANKHLKRPKAHLGLNSPLVLHDGFPLPRSMTLQRKGFRFPNSVDYTGLK
jgi:hypothetical protein